MSTHCTIACILYTSSPFCHACGEAPLLLSKTVVFVFARFFAPVPFFLARVTLIGEGSADCTGLSSRRYSWCVGTEATFPIDVGGREDGCGKDAEGMTVTPGGISPCLSIMTGSGTS